jgi:Zn-dependent protease
MEFLAQQSRVGLDIPPASTMLAIAIVIFFAIGLHEYAHAKVADMAGDPTPRLHGRVTLNLTKHFDLMGTIMIIITSLAGVGIGWGKPVPMDPRKMKNPRWDHFAAVAAGPITNLLLAIGFAIVIRIMIASGTPLTLPSEGSDFLSLLLFYGLIINISLLLFNLLPIGPLDGMWLLGTMLPDSARVGWVRWNLTVGQFVFLGIVIFGQLTGFSIIGQILEPAMLSLVRLLLGIRA